MEWILNIDLYLFELINSNGGKFLDPIMILISSKWAWAPLYIYLLYLIYKKFSNKFIWILISLILLILIADQGSVHLFKNVFERLRPCYQLENVRIVESCGGLYGFISSHASNTFALTFFLHFLFKNKQLFLWLTVWSFMIGISRIYLGVHFPSDILGGICWSFIVSVFVYRLLKFKLDEAI